MAQLQAGATNHFRQRHLSNPPQGNGKKVGERVSQIIGMTRAEFMRGRPGDDVWLTCTIREWSWRNDQWNEVPGGTSSLRVHLRGTWTAGPGSNDTHPIGHFTGFGWQP